MKARGLFCLAVSLLLFVSFGAIPQAAGAEGTQLTAGALTLRLDPATGRVAGLTLNGADAYVNTTSGFRITDCASGEKVLFEAPVEGNGTLSQQGAVGETGLTLTVNYQTRGNAVLVEGEISDTAGADRLVRVEYLLPVKNDGLYWYQNTEDAVKIKNNSDYSTAAQKFLNGHKTGLYPLGAVSNGAYGAAMAVPMDPPLASLVSYKTADSLQDLVLRIDGALSAQADKSPSKLSFSFVVYAPSLPEWGFRSALQEYYGLFPEYFEDRAEGGNWLFQHNYVALTGPEDFWFGFNETPGSYRFDQQQGVVSLQYTGPNFQDLDWPGGSRDKEPTPQEYLQRIRELSGLPEGTKDPLHPYLDYRDTAAALLNSAMYNAAGNVVANDWYFWGNYAGISVNEQPDIPGFNSYQVMMAGVEQAEQKAAAEGARLGGVYIDNLGGFGGQNYRADHFAYSDVPLLWDENGQLYAPVYGSMYAYTKAVRERGNEKDQIVFANVVFPERGCAPYVFLVDAPGSEMGPHWGWDPYIQRLRRSMAYQKPWALLLGHDLNSNSTSASSCPYEIKEDIMRSAVAYGLFANVIGYRVPMSEYETSRPLFRKYAYTVVMEDRLGWEPVTFAAAEGEGWAECNRFGDPGSGAALFTAYNTGERAGDFNGAVAVDLAALGVSDSRAAGLIAYDTLNNRTLPVRIADGKLRYDLSLKSLEVSAVLIGTRAEIVEQLYEKIASDVDRLVRTCEKINRELTEAEIDPPAVWEELDRAISRAGAFKDKDAAGILRELPALTACFREAAEVTDRTAEDMLVYKNVLTVDVLNVCRDAVGMLSGLSGMTGDADGDGQITSTDARLTLQIAVNKIGKEDAANPDGTDVDGDNSVTSTDARLILQKAVGKIQNWP